MFAASKATQCQQKLLLDVPQADCASVKTSDFAAIPSRVIDVPMRAIDLGEERAGQGECCEEQF